jgi:hypothetical protein
MPFALYGALAVWLSRCLGADIGLKWKRDWRACGHSARQEQRQSGLASIAGVGTYRECAAPEEAAQGRDAA